MNGVQIWLKAISDGFSIDKRTQIEKESTQGIRLQSDHKSPGTGYSFEPPIASGMGAFGVDPYGMNPVNGEHWMGLLHKSGEMRSLVSNGVIIHRGVPNPVDLLHVITEPQEAITAGSLNAWRTFYDHNTMMQKGYNPLQSLY
jgi:hypothetical protein